MPTVVDVYEEARRESFKELDLLSKDRRINKVLKTTLSNNSKQTNYPAWSKGCAQFLEDHYDAFKKIGFEI